jgi:hypothetical protein
VGGLTCLAIFASAWGLERVRFAPEWVVALRYVTWGTFLVSTYLFLVRPLIRRVSDGQVALYLEEHEPSLEHAVVSALDQNPGFSEGLRNRVVDVALERARHVQYGRRVEQGRLYRFAGALTVVGLLALGMTLLGPAHLRYGLGALLMPTRDAAEVNPYSIAVTPGDITIPRNTDQLVAATLGGFDASDASIFTRTASDGGFQRLTMLPGVEGGFEALLLGVAERTEYFVESTGVRSPTFTIEVADLPYVGKLDLTYFYPGYTGLPPRVVENAGDVAALPGTVIELRIQPTMMAPGGRLMLDYEPAADLTLQDDGTFVTRFTLGDDSYYAIELARDNGTLVPASPEYTIDLLEDQDPAISFSRPGRDDSASPIEEFYLEMNATDDYGVRDVRLVYSVNAGPEDTIAVFQTSGAPLSEVAPAHTLFLEEWQLEPGDLVSYYAIARDNRPNPTAVTSDIYFITVRPFERAYRQAEQGGGGGGGGGGQQETPLSELQRQIIAATFNLIRQQESYSASEFRENVNSVGLAQVRLTEQVGTLLQRMQNRGLTQSDPGFRDVSAILPQAVDAMQRAKAHLDDLELREALPDEQEALRFLQQAEETYERYVQQQQGGGGGGGGAQDRAAAEELADLFELELDKLQNQYETVQRGQREQSDNQVDELMERLQELARRQEQEAERQRRRALQSGQTSSGGGGQSQRDLAEETEEAARQLERLARETNDRQLEETARDLQQAAEAMRQSASQSGSTGATAEANSALRRLEDARRQLEERRQDRARRDTEAAIQEVDQLQQQQRDVVNDVRELPAERNTARSQQVRQLQERKEQMNDAVANLERELDRAASGARADNPQAARTLQDAANQIRESKLREKLQYSRGTIEQWDPQTATTLELNIEADLQALRDQLEEALDASSERSTDPMERALEDTQQLVRGMEAMGRRLNEPTPGQQGDQQDQQGQQGQQGDQQGQQGQQGDQQDQQAQQGQQGDQQGQQGQQGQSQQGDQQGQQGQQGQGQQGDQQGQQGQQGGQGQQQGQPGQQGGQRGGLDADGWAGGYDAMNWGGGPRGEPRRLTPDEARQYQAELRERMEQVEGLRSELRNMGQPVEDVQAVLEALGRMSDERLLTDPRALAAVHEEMLDRLKRIEFTLRREVEGEADRSAPTLTGSDEVPDGYRSLVEEYYRSLARGEAAPAAN